MLVYNVVLKVLRNQQLLGDVKIRKKLSSNERKMLGKKVRIIFDEFRANLKDKSCHFLDNYNLSNLYLFLERIKVIGEQLDLIRVSRTEMGAYLCIAQNKVPPSISKRIILNVECKYILVL